jgi:hypothetical protein
MQIEVWEDESGITCFPKGDYDQNKIYFDGEHCLLRTIKGKDWKDCMRKHHEIMGWKPYKPIEE